MRVLFSWQAQYLVNLECRFSWQAQHFARNVVFVHTKCVAKMQVASSPKRWVRMQTFGQDEMKSYYFLGNVFPSSSKEDLNILGP